MTTLNVTQVAIEQWATTIPPAMQMTQAAIEQWATVIPPAINVTQVGAEIWTSTAVLNARLGGQSALATGVGLGLVMVSE